MKMAGVNIEVVDGFLSALECPVCKELMTLPIFLCLHGHSLCSTCKQRVENCPICRKPFKRTRNYSLEHIAQHVKLSCENAEAGCTTLALAANAKSHRSVCPYRLYDCLPGKKKDCKWKGRRFDILSHVEKEHSAFVWTVSEDVVIEEFILSVQFEEDKKGTELLSAYNDIFWIHWAYKAFDETLYISVHYIGPQENCSKYFYKISYISSSRPQHLVIFSTETHPDHVDIEELILRKECSSLHKGMSQHFLSGGILTYYLKIVKC